MQEALPYRSWVSSSTSKSPVLRQHNDGFPSDLSCVENTDHGGRSNSSNDSVRKMLSENAIIIFGRHGCCMSCVVKSLLLAVGANPSIFEVGGDDSYVDPVVEDGGVRSEISKFVEGTVDDSKVQFPIVFVGGKFFGGLERIMATHISGELVPILKEAGALWL